MITKTRKATSQNGRGGPMFLNEGWSLDRERRHPEHHTSVRNIPRTSVRSQTRCLLCGVRGKSAGQAGTVRAGWDGSQRLSLSAGT